MHNRLPKYWRVGRISQARSILALGPAARAPLARSSWHHHPTTNHELSVFLLYHAAAWLFASTLGIVSPFDPLWTMVHPALNRHPRFAIASAVGLLTILLLLSGQHSFTLPGSQFVGLNVRQRVDDAEKDYGAVVSKRHAFIRKMGPDPTRVEACVTKIALSQSFD